MLVMLDRSITFITAYSPVVLCILLSYRISLYFSTFYKKPRQFVKGCSETFHHQVFVSTVFNSPDNHRHNSLKNEDVLLTANHTSEIFEISTGPEDDGELCIDLHREPRHRFGDILRVWLAARPGAHGVCSSDNPLVRPRLAVDRGNQCLL